MDESEQSIIANCLTLLVKNQQLITTVESSTLNYMINSLSIPELIKSIKELIDSNKGSYKSMSDQKIGLKVENKEESDLTS
jgi:hypothetical protein